MQACQLNVTTMRRRYSGGRQGEAHRYFLPSQMNLI